VNNFNNVAKDTLDEWIYYFKNNSLQEKYRGKGLDKVEAQQKINTMKTKERKEYEDYIKGLVVSKSMIETAKWEGKLEGKLKERKEAKRDFTINLIKQTDFSDEKIALLVGVDEALVAEIRKGLNP
jgi:hypothetical protein